MRSALQDFAVNSVAYMLVSIVGSVCLGVAAFILTLAYKLCAWVLL